MLVCQPFKLKLTSTTLLSESINRITHPVLDRIRPK
ncbi:hypothetical protein X992_5259 [Burkholderia pseudomallei MSHR5492]|nr:hypothetical protein X992_5259 [Burkholderia pseudomallei MSHR5492]